MTEKTKVTKAVIAAAGFGTRFLPQTKAMPKEMLPLVDKPIIQYIVEELVDAGIKDIVMVTGYSKRTIEDHFDEPSQDLQAVLKAGGKDKAHLLEQIEDIGKLANFTYVRQKGRRGTGGALLSAAHLIGNEPFIYTSGDDFIMANPSRFKQLTAAYDEYNCSVLGCIKVEEDEDYDRYGFAGGKELKEGLIQVDKIIEKPGKTDAPSDLATVSGYILAPQIFSYLEQVEANLAENQELYYNDALKLMLKDGFKVLACQIKDAKYYDAGNKLDYVKTIVDFALLHPEIKDDFAAYLRQLEL